TGLGQTAVHLVHGMHQPLPCTGYTIRNKDRAERALHSSDTEVRHRRKEKLMGRGYREGRLGEEIRRSISEMLLREIKDPRLSSGMLSISEVDVTTDGSYATCYITVLTQGQSEEEKQEEEKQVLAGLNSAKGLMKKEIGR